MSVLLCEYPQPVEAGAPEAFQGAFAALVQDGADALMIMASPLFARHWQRLLELALRHRLPTMTGGRFFAEAGSLLAYGAFPRELCQRSAVLVDKILKGAQPADLPVERADKFSLSVNLKTAGALGLTLSPLFLSRVWAVRGMCWTPLWAGVAVVPRLERGRCCVVDRRSRDGYAGPSATACWAGPVQGVCASRERRLESP